MSVINPLAREISAKIVFYGPGLSGKTTTLRWIYQAVKPQRRGELVSLATEGDRTIFFDFLPLHVERVRSMGVRFQLYTVPGQVFYEATRRLVLNGADGVVFVADSQAAMHDANLSSLNSLKANLKNLGISAETFPLVFQYNKRDLEGAVPIEQLSKELNWRGAPEFGTSATEGLGVMAVLKEVAHQVIRSLWSQHQGPEFGEEEPTGRSFSLRDEDDSIVAKLSSLTSRKLTEPPPAPPATNAQAEPMEDFGMSFAPFWDEQDASDVVTVEAAIRQRQYSNALQVAATALIKLLDALPGAASTEGHMAKATLLGLDGREYLRLCRLAGQPEGSIGELDALFALHLLVSARVKFLAI